MAVNLGTLPVPKILENVGYNDLLEAVRDNFRARNTDYTSIVEGDPGYTLLEGMAYFGTLLFAHVDDAVIAVLITHSTGDDLEVLAAGFNVERRTDETDEELRQRTIDTLETLVPGSPAWYRNYALEANTNVKDARVTRKPDPNDADNDIAGEVNVYIQGKTTAIPSSTILQDVKDYINAEGSSYTDDQDEVAAEQRRFICDTVNVEPVSIQPYIICAYIHIIPGLDKLTVLETVEELAQEFADEQTRIGRKIPISSVYAALDTDSVSEVTLEHPTEDIEPAKDTVPVPLPTEQIAVQEYKTFDTWLNFGLTTGAGWSVGQDSDDDWHIVFTQDITTADGLLLDNIRAGRRFGIYSTDSNGEEDELVYTYRADGEKDTYVNPSNTDNPDNRLHNFIALKETPTTTDLTVGDNYIVKLLNSVEIRAIGL